MALGAPAQTICSGLSTHCLSLSSLQPAVPGCHGLVMGCASCQGGTSETLPWETCAIFPQLGIGPQTSLARSTPPVAGLHRLQTDK